MQQQTGQSRYSGSGSNSSSSNSSGSSSSSSSSHSKSNGNGNKSNGKSNKQIIVQKPRQKLIGPGPNRIYEFNEMTSLEKKQFVREVVIRIKELMDDHIGRDRAINSEELFETVYLIAAKTLSEYEVRFWRDLLNRAIYHLRNKEILFIVNEGGKYIYVLKTESELNIFKGMMDKYIDGCNLMKTKATSWVRNKKWLR